MSDCLFCKIFNGSIPSNKVYQKGKVIAFHDIQPLASIHVLFIHENHAANVNEMNSSDVAEVFSAIKEWTQSQKLPSSGFRVVVNSGPHAGQTVFHTHFHVLGGESLGSFGRR
jgi:histidine triad (HIT) family protein